MYYTLKAKYPELFKSYKNNPEEFQRSNNKIMYVAIPKLTKNQERIMIYKLLDTNPDKFIIQDLLKYCVQLSMLLLHNDYAKSEIHIIDWGGFTMSHLKKLDFTIISRYFSIYLGTFSSRISAIHYINNPKFLDSILIMFKTLLKSKLFERIIVHKNVDSLKNHIPKEYLPLDYEGKERSVREIHEDWVKEFEMQEYLFESESKSITDESKRIGDPPFNSEHFGVDGTFRKLNLD